jgi:hypothetical protein
MKGESVETSSPPEKPLTYQPSPSGDKERKSCAASSEENTGNTSSPEAKKKWGSSKPLLSYPTIR